MGNLLNLIEEDLKPVRQLLQSQDFHTIDYDDIVTYYHSTITKHSIKKRHRESAYLKLVRKLNEWESMHYDIIEGVVANA